MEKELEKLMKENPTLPLVFSCSSDELEEGYITFYKNFTCKVVTIYETEERVFDNTIDIYEYYEGIYENEDEIVKAIEETVQYKAIMVYCN